MVKIDASDLKDLAREFAEDAIDIRRELRKVIVGTAFAVESNAKRSLNEGGKSGKAYKKYVPRRTHKASAKGQAPASDTGNLANSIRVNEKFGLSAEVIANAKYSGRLEDDLDRPFMEPAYKKEESNLERELNRAIDRALR